MSMLSFLGHFVRKLQLVDVVVFVVFCINSIQTSSCAVFLFMHSIFIRIITTTTETATTSAIEVYNVKHCNAPSYSYYYGFFFVFFITTFFPCCCQSFLYKVLWYNTQRLNLIFICIHSYIL